MLKVRSGAFCLALLIAAPAVADELADASKLLADKSYPQALVLFTKLAKAGHPTAQLHLGEMYWYGEAGRIDLEQARHWFSQSAAGGNREAAAALDVMAQREARRQDIDYWVNTYDAKDMASGAFNCVPPAIPQLSKSNADIVRVEADYAAWQACYNGFVQNLSDALPPGKRIPPDIARLMNQIEYDQSMAHLGKVYAALSEQAGAAAKATVARYQDWRKTTEQFVAARNAESKAETDLAVEQLRRANASIGRSVLGGKP